MCSRESGPNWAGTVFDNAAIHAFGHVACRLASPSLGTLPGFGITSTPTLPPGAALRGAKAVFGSVAVGSLDQYGRINQVGWSASLPSAAIAPIPLPAAGWMLLAGLAGTALVRLRRGT